MRRHTHVSRNSRPNTGCDDEQGFDRLRRVVEALLDIDLGLGGREGQFEEDPPDLTEQDVKDALRLIGRALHRGSHTPHEVTPCCDKRRALSGLRGRRIDQRKKSGNESAAFRVYGRRKPITSDPTSPNYQNPERWGRTALHEAVMARDLERVKYLVEEVKVDLLVEDNGHYTAFGLACREEYPEIMQYLSEYYPYPEG